MLISVVVPVYNPGLYITELLDSLRAQTLADDAWEAVFVDDGSTDATPARLDRFAASMRNVRVIHTPNSGWPGRPRNIGIDAARGDYVFLSDADDYLHPRALERLADFARANEPDPLASKLAGVAPGQRRDANELVLRFMSARTVASGENESVADPTWWRRPLDLPDRYRDLPFEILEGPEEAAAMLADRAALEAGPVSALQEVGQLHPPTPVHVLLTVTAGRSGELIALWCDAADEHVLVRTADSDPHIGPGSRASHAVDVTVTVDSEDGSRATEVLVPEVWLTYPLVDTLTDGSFLIVSEVCELRADGPDLNGIVVDGLGNVLRRVMLGDGVLATQATTSGKTWIGYSDTGILGNNGWNGAGDEDRTMRSSAPVGAFGLVRFDDTYSVDWEFGRAWYEAEKRDREIIDHVYALNVVDETAWVYYHSAYSIARVLDDEIRIWNTDVELAHGLLINGARQALVGGYGPKYDRIVIGHLDDADFVPDSTGRIVLPDGSDLPLTTRRTSRGSTHHVIADDRWYRLVL